MFLSKSDAMKYSPVDRPLNGVVTTEVLYQNVNRQVEINERMLQRTQNNEMQEAPHFTPRSVMTKYAMFPMIDNRMPANVPILRVKSGPDVLVETELRNQDSALQKGAPQGEYIPASTSDLYRVQHVGGLGTGENNAHGLLFQTFAFDRTVHPNLREAPTLGTELLHNSTRTQLYD
jgi:hypothetical protein